MRNELGTALASAHFIWLRWGRYKTTSRCNFQACGHLSAECSYVSARLSSPLVANATGAQIRAKRWRALSSLILMMSCACVCRRSLSTKVMRKWSISSIPAAALWFCSAQCKFAGDARAFFALLLSAGAANNTSSRRVSRSRSLACTQIAPAENHLCVKGKLTFRSRLFHSSPIINFIALRAQVMQCDARIPKLRRNDVNWAKTPMRLW